MVLRSIHMIDINNIKKISKEFTDYFKSKGYILCPSEPIIPTRDKTIAFTNATIIPLKSYLVKSYSQPGFVVCQPCIRLWNIANNNFDGSFTSFFRMVSILIHPNIEINTILKEIFEYIKNVLNISDDKITIHSNSSTNDLSDELHKKYKVLQNKFDDKFYKWNYGFSDIKGRGITIFVDSNGKSRELGNFVQIKRGNKIIGYEFGFGIESCIGIINGYQNNFDVLFGKNINKKLFDITCTRVVIEQALKTNPGKISGTTRSSIRKVDNEMIYSICEFENGNCDYIKNIKWDLMDVSTEIIDNFIPSLEEKINQVKKDIKLLIDYKDYISKMIKSGKNQSWGDKKINNYIRKNNYQRIVDLINKNISL
jgi:alanyl-tRNA synthetase